MNEQAHRYVTFYNEGFLLEEIKLTAVEEQIRTRT
jgi:hypothetical protein